MEEENVYFVKEDNTTQQFIHQFVTSIQVLSR